MIFQDRTIFTAIIATNKKDCAYWICPRLTDRIIMQNVLLDFNRRVQDVDDYFIFLESLEKQTTQLAFLDTTGKYQIKILDSELAKTLKANGFLLLYNLVESTMRNAIESIF